MFFKNLRRNLFKMKCSFSIRKSLYNVRRQLLRIECRDICLHYRARAARRVLAPPASKCSFSVFLMLIYKFLPVSMLIIVI